MNQRLLFKTHSHSSWGHCRQRKSKRVEPSYPAVYLFLQGIYTRQISEHKCWYLLSMRWISKTLAKTQLLKHPSFFMLGHRNNKVHLALALECGKWYRWPALTQCPNAGQNNSTEMWPYSYIDGLVCKRRDEHRNWTCAICYCYFKILKYPKSQMDENPKNVSNSE